MNAILWRRMEKSTGINYCGGDSIGRVVIFELNKHTSDFFDGILEMAKRHSELEISSLVHEPVLSLPGLEIDLTHRKVYCGNTLFFVCSWQMRIVF